jgi:hypothetical protein
MDLAQPGVVGKASWSLSDACFIASCRQHDGSVGEIDVNALLY